MYPGRRGLELLEPLASRLSRTLERCDDRLRRCALLELTVDAQLDRAPGEPPQLLVRAEYLRLDAGHHARDSLIADLGEDLLAEREERQISTVPQE
jgi:hypothetical protein